jgi:hypothetical protein
MNFDSFYKKYAFPLAIAITTTVLTTSILNALLPSVWCMETTADGNHRVLYGEQRCSALLSTP